MEIFMQEAEDILQQCKERGKTLNELWVALDAVKNLKKKNIPEKYWTKLLEISGKIDDPNLVSAAIRLKELEDKTKLSYENLIKQYKSRAQELPKLEQEMKKEREELEHLNEKITGSKDRLDELKSDFDKELKEQSLTREKIKLIDELSKVVFPGSTDIKRDVVRVVEEVKSLVKAREEEESNLRGIIGKSQEAENTAHRAELRAKEFEARFYEIAEVVFKEVYKELDRKFHFSGEIDAIGFKRIIQGTADIAAKKLKEGEGWILKR